MKAKNKNNRISISLLAVLSLLTTGCNTNTNQPITEIGEDFFVSKIEKYGIELVNKNTQLDQSLIDSYSNEVGSKSHETLLNDITDTREIESTRYTSFALISNGNEVIEHLRMVSTANKTPHIYTLSGNYHYSTGLCSNVVGIQAKSKDTITIRNCIFENMSGISLWNCNDVIIEDCYFKGAENGIYMSKCTNIEIRNCTFDMNSTGLTDYYQGVYLGDGNNGVTVSNCLFNAEGDIKKPYRIGSKSDDYEPSSNVKFEGCVSKGHFRSGFQNIDGTASLNNCKFFFDHDKGSYGNAIIIDDKSDAIYTTLTDCEFYLSYRKNPSSSDTTKFDGCTYSLYLAD